MRKPLFTHFLRGAVLASSAAWMMNPAQADKAALSDAQIIGIYIQVNSFDIETALLGRTQGTSPELRKLADHVASDHLGVRQAAYTIAESCKAAPALPSERDAAAIGHANTMTRLARLKGSEFDKAYLEHEIAFHTAAISAVKTVLLPNSVCPQLQAHLRKVLPAFEHHLEATQALTAQEAVSNP